MAHAAPISQSGWRLGPVQKQVSHCGRMRGPSRGLRPRSLGRRTSGTTRSVAAGALAIWPTPAVLVLRHLFLDKPLLALTVLATIAAACGGPPPPGPAQGPTAAGWLAPLGHDHPLIGRVWETDARRFVPPEVVIARAARVRFVLLGEKHDNPDHHRLQAWVTRALAAAGSHRTAAFEMLDADDRKAIEEAVPRTSEALAKAVDWAGSGWPAFEMYAPIFDALLIDGAQIRTALPSRPMLRALMREGLDTLSGPHRETLHMDEELPTAYEAELRGEVQEGHCGHAPPKMVDQMVLAQRFKDAWMADRLAHGSADEGALLVAGAGHVRRDRGVPLHLARQGHGGGTLTVGFVEVRAGRHAPTDYDVAAFDFAVFTARVDDLSPCDRFKAALEKMSRPKPAVETP